MTERRLPRHAPGEQLRHWTVGIDIVDLHSPRSVGKGEDERFLERVFTPAEAAAIRASTTPDRMLWCLWGAKEAAFKIASKVLDPPPVFTHCKFRVLSPGVTLGSDVNEGWLEYEKLLIPFQCAKSKAGAQHVVAWWPPTTAPEPLRWDSRDPPPPPPKGLLLGVFEIPQEPDEADREIILRERFTGREQEAVYAWPSAAVRLEARQAASQALTIPEKSLEIIPAREGPPGRTPPTLLINREESAGDISLSHDGRFGAWALLLPD